MNTNKTGSIVFYEQLSSRKHKSWERGTNQRKVLFKNSMIGQKKIWQKGYMSKHFIGLNSDMDLSMQT